MDEFNKLVLISVLFGAFLGGSIVGLVMYIKMSKDINILLEQRNGLHLEISRLDYLNKTYWEFSVLKMNKTINKLNEMNSNLAKMERDFATVEQGVLDFNRNISILGKSVKTEVEKTIVMQKTIAKKINNNRVERKNKS